MADESIWTYGSTITCEESGASIADAVFTQADDANLTAANQADYTHCDVLLSTVDTTVNPDIGGVVNVYLRPINIEGTEDQPPPSANFPHKFLCAMPIDDDEALTQAIKVEARLPNPNDDCEAYIENQCGQTISAGWNLRITPKALRPAP